MNWPKLIILAFVLFAIYMLYFLGSIILQGSEKTPAKYYEKGNQYQKVLDAANNAKTMGITLGTDAIDGNVVINADSTVLDSAILGIIWPPDARQNQKRKIYSLVKGQNIIQTKLHRGFWNVELQIWNKSVQGKIQRKLWVN